MADEPDNTPGEDQPTPEEAVDAAKAAADNLEAAADDAPPSDDTEDGLAAAKAAVDDAASTIDAQGADAEPADPSDPAPSDGSPSDDEPTERLAALDLPAFDEGAVVEDAKGIDLLGDVNLNVSIELGRTRMYVEDVLKLNEGAVVELDKLAGDPVDVYVNDRLVARGEVLVLNDTFCIRVNEIVKQGADIIAEAG